MINSVLKNLKKIKAADVVYQLKQRTHFDELSQKTSEEAEKALGWVVDKFVDGIGEEPVSKEVRTEIVKHYLGLKPQAILKAIKTDAKIADKVKIDGLNELKTFRKTTAENVVSSAKERLAARTPSETKSAE